MIFAFLFGDGIVLWEDSSASLSFIGSAGIWRSLNKTVQLNISQHSESEGTKQDSSTLCKDANNHCVTSEDCSFS